MRNSRNIPLSIPERKWLKMMGDRNSEDVFADESGKYVLMGTKVYLPPMEKIKEDYKRELERVNL